MRAELTSIALAAIGSAVLLSTPAAAMYQNYCNGVCGTGVSCTSTPAATGGSNSIQHPQIVPIFWQDPGLSGHQWSAGSNSPTMGQAISQIINVVQSPFAASLTQYGTINGHNGSISRPRMSHQAPTYTGASPLGNGDTTSNYNTADIQAIVNYQITAGLVPQPLGPYDNVFYMVFVAGTATSTDARTNGYTTIGSTAAGTVYTYSYVNSANFGQTLTHEMAEGIVQIWQNVSLSGSCQFLSTMSSGCTKFGSASGISDVCQCNNEAGYGQWASNPATNTADGYQVQSYWSQSDGKCVIPEDWGELIQNTGSGWTFAGGNSPSQMYGGAGGVVTTHADSPYFWNGSSWTQLANIQGVAYAAGGGHIAAIQQDSSQAVRWQNIGGSWNSLPVLNITVANYPNPMPLTSVMVADASGGAVAVTAATGEVYAWDWNAGAWVDLQGNCDHVLADGSDLLCTSLSSRHAIYDYAGYQFGTTGTTWTRLASTSYPMVQIVTSPELAAYFGVIPAGTMNLYFATNNEVAVGAIGASGLEWGTSFASGATFFDASYSSQYVDSWTYASSVWSDTGSAAIGRLASGKYEFATYCSGSLPCVSYCKDPDTQCLTNSDCCSNYCSGNVCY